MHPIVRVLFESCFDDGLKAIANGFQRFASILETLKMTVP